MTISKFRDHLKLSKYFFDHDRDVVMSTQRPGEPRPIKWAIVYSQRCRRVSLVNDRGEKTSLTYNQVMANLVDVPVTKGPAAGPVLGEIAPTNAYVMYSDADRCSQYFFAGTTLQQALDKFAKRGLHLKPENIRILNTVTGKIHKVVATQRVVYSLV